MYVIVAVPAATAVTTPVEEFTVAKLVLSLLHAPPEFPLELNVVVPFEQIACVPLSVPAFGAAVTVTVLVAVSFAQPPVPVTIYLIVVVPAATGVITPVLASTVAIPVFTELNAPPVSPFEENVVVPSEQIDWVPLSVPALGSVVTVTVLVADESLQPPVPVMVYVIVAVPDATAVTTPVELFTVATPASLLDHAPPEFPLELNVVVPFEQIACVPLSVPAFGAVVTVTVLVAVSFAHPPVPVTMYLMVVVPAATGVISPVLASTVAIPVFTELNVPPVLPSVVNVVVPSEQIDWVPLSVPAFGSVVTVTVLVADESLQPPVPVTVYVIVALPAATAVTTPVEALTVAKLVLSLVHAPPASPFELNVVVPLEQIACVPLSVPALGAAVTVTVLVAVSLAQPPVPVTIYLIVVVPAATGVITPVEAFTVATPVLTELHAPLSPSVENVVVPSEHTDCVPESTPAFGSVVTVTVLVADESLQPPVPVMV